MRYVVLLAPAIAMELGCARRGETRLPDAPPQTVIDVSSAESTVGVADSGGESIRSCGDFSERECPFDRCALTHEHYGPGHLQMIRRICTDRAPVLASHDRTLGPLRQKIAAMEEVVRTASGKQRESLDRKLDYLKWHYFSGAFPVTHFAASI